MEKLFITYECIFTSVYSLIIYKSSSFRINLSALLTYDRKHLCVFHINVDSVFDVCVKVHNDCRFTHINNVYIYIYIYTLGAVAVVPYTPTAVVVLVVLAALIVVVTCGISACLGAQGHCCGCLKVR